MSGDAVPELNAKSGQGGLPIPEWHVPCLADVMPGQTERLSQCFVAGNVPRFLLKFLNLKQFP